MIVDIPSAHSKGVHKVDTMAVTCDCGSFVHNNGYYAIGNDMRLCPHLRSALEQYPHEFPLVYRNSALERRISLIRRGVTYSVAHSIVLGIKSLLMSAKGVDSVYMHVNKENGMLKGTPILNCYAPNGVSVDALVKWIELGYEVSDMSIKGCRIKFIADGMISVVIHIVDSKSLVPRLILDGLSVDENLSIRARANDCGYTITEDAIIGKDGSVLQLSSIEEFKSLLR